MGMYHGLINKENSKGRHIGSIVEHQIGSALA